jgi:hypothetical protein
MPRIVVLQAIQQIPQEYAIKALRPVVKVLPGVCGFRLSTQMAIHPQEKIAHKEFIDTSRKEVDIFTADGSHVQSLGLRPISQLLHDERQGVARIAQQLFDVTISILGAQWFHLE